MEKILKIREEFGPITGLRHYSISEKSGEEFYHTILNKVFKQCYESNVELIVDLDNVRGYSPSFIDEAFGNLVFDFELRNVKKYLKIKSDDMSFWKSSIENDTYRLWEYRREKNEVPKKSHSHKPWWKIVNGKLEEGIWIQS
jgi:hypothetical protein